MPDALVRNVDEDLLADYRAEARANGRSLQAELNEGLKRGRPRRRLSKSELLDLSRSLTGSGPVTSDSTADIRWARDTDGGRHLGGGRPDADRR
ncbi:FitA-like ribbon-helix-helix domain-containing protein [Sphingosinicella sp. LY1275]|uniref:FitA-like ribbon-helix-helix domain-containing protein n=1 Tax=Sphingosinicella sp. LY1275 TaxID=3095379 RepID=UPI003A100A75